MAELNLTQHPHRRFNPLKQEWVLVSPHRTQRPWQGRIEEAATPPGLKYDPSCYLCPGNARAGGVRNPEYQTTFVFENDFPALLPRVPESQLQKDDLIIAAGEQGLCQVVCFSPEHDLTVARMEVPALRMVVDVWTDLYRQLGAEPWTNHVQIFENRGALMGASNPHPHCQVWSNASLPNEAVRELEAQSAYRAQHLRCLLCSYLELELREQARIVVENDGFIALVPFWAIWPFETLVISRRHLGGMDQFNQADGDAMADILKRVTTRYDNLFETSFPYSMGFHQRPTDGMPHPEWHFHAHFYPPLLRSATVQKFMVGYEMLATPQRDITPESAAERLRAVGEIHFRERR
jgi:UDPglucose--hexose-1-phosphate uridylyltransferase